MAYNALFKNHENGNKPDRSAELDENGRNRVTMHAANKHAGRDCDCAHGRCRHRDPPVHSICHRATVAPETGWLVMLVLEKGCQFRRCVVMRTRPRPSRASACRVDTYSRHRMANASTPAQVGKGRCAAADEFDQACFGRQSASPTPATASTTPTTTAASCLEPNLSTPSPP